MVALALLIIYLVGTNTIVVAARVAGVPYVVLDLAFWPLWLPGEVFVALFTIENTPEDL